MLTVLARRTLTALLFGVAALGAQPPASGASRVTTGTLAGVVRDTLGNVLADVDVSIPDLGRTERSDAAGNFVLAQVPPGTYEVWTRRIGFIIIQFTWTARADERLEVALTMRPLPHTLDPVTIWASEDRQMKSKSVVKGTVIDSAGFPVLGAEVQLIGSGRATVTAGDGTFVFRHVKTGELMLRARLLGYSPSVARFKLVDDDEREVFLRMGNLAQQLDEVRITEESGFGRSTTVWKELDSRVRFHTEGSTRIFGPEQLRKLGATPLDFVTRGLSGGGGGTSAISRMKHGGSLAEGDVCILENGYRPLSRPLRSYSASDVEMIEYYPEARNGHEMELTGTVVWRMATPGCEGQYGDHPAYYVLWLKGAR